MYVVCYSSKKMAVKKDKFSDSEIRVLLEEMTIHFKYVMSKLSGNQITSAGKRDLWNTITGKINAVGGCCRSTEDVKKKWRKLVCHTRKEMHAVKDPATGGGPPPTLGPYHHVIAEIIASKSALAAGVDKGPDSSSTSLLAPIRQDEFTQLQCSTSTVQQGSLEASEATIQLSVDPGSGLIIVQSPETINRPSSSMPRRTANMTKITTEELWRTYLQKQANVLGLKKRKLELQIGKLERALQEDIKDDGTEDRSSIDLSMNKPSSSNESTVPEILQACKIVLSKKSRLAEEFLNMEKEKVKRLSEVVAVPAGQPNDEWSAFCTSLACDLRKIKDPYIIMKVKSETVRVVNDNVLLQLRKERPVPSSPVPSSPVPSSEDCSQAQSLNPDW